MPSRYTIITDFERPDPALVKAIDETFYLFTAMAAGPRQTMTPAIKPLDPSSRICGPAFTVRAEYSEDSSMSYLANIYAKPGDVIVVDAAGRTDVAVWGGSMARGAVQAGAAGVVIDGMCESAETIRNVSKLPMFCRGSAPQYIPQQRGGWLNCPVICGGVIVYPGDIVVANGDGVAVVPKARAEAILAASEERAKRYRGPNRIQNIPFRESHAADIARIQALPDTDWRP